MMNSPHSDLSMGLKSSTPAWAAMGFVPGADTSIRSKGLLDQFQPATQLESTFMYSDSMSATRLRIGGVWSVGERVCVFLGLGVM